MRWSQLRRTWRTLLLVQALFLLVACSSGTSSHPASVSTPLPTPTSGVTITPTPTIPVVPSRPVHFFTSDHVQLAGLLFGHGRTAGGWVDGYWKKKCVSGYGGSVARIRV